MYNITVYVQQLGAATFAQLHVMGSVTINPYMFAEIWFGHEKPGPNHTNAYPDFVELVCVISYVIIFKESQ